jgi:uncharacterized protein (TIGR03118 family)
MQRRRITLILFLAVTLLAATRAATAQYELKNLSSNQVRHARHIDPLLVNGWGLVHGPGSPWWVSDNNSGWSTLYDGDGNTIQTLKVLIPTAGENGPGSPTGIVFNGTAGPKGSHEFQVQGWASIFLFAALDGTISGWAPQSNFNQSIVAVDNSKAGSMYTGLAITNRSKGNLLYAADLANNKVDVFDASFKLVNSFTDTTLPAGFAPFGIQDINGLVYVAFASTTGGAGGFVDQFTEDGKLLNGKPLIQGAPLNQPWGIAAAPSNFGPLSNRLLISNNTDTGTINAFDSTTGKFVGVLTNDDGEPIRIDQLWGISFGDGLGKNGAANQLFFTAGPSGNLAGTFGVIVFEP